ncbi:MAG: amidohydrolase family protein [Acidobacteriaceae bacterium]
MIYDANAFIGKWPYWPIRSSNPAQVAGELAGWSIDRATICSTRSVFVHWEDGNIETEAAARQDPTRFTPFACLGTLELSHRLQQGPYDFTDYMARGFRGVRLYPQHHSYHPLYAAFVDSILENALQRGWPVLLPLRIIMNWGMPSLDLAVMETLVERHPRVNWILAGINYLYELQLAIYLMRRYPGVHLETSCVMGYAAIAKIVQQCGAQQILFGSGAPVQHGAAALSKILRARICDSDREAILGTNLQRLLGET